MKTFEELLGKEWLEKYFDPNKELDRGHDSSSSLNWFIACFSRTSADSNNKYVCYFVGITPGWKSVHDSMSPLTLRETNKDCMRPCIDAGLFVPYKYNDMISNTDFVVSEKGYEILTIYNTLYCL